MTAPDDPRRTLWNWLWPALCVGAIVLVSRADVALVGVLRVGDPELLKIRDWWQFLRVFGYVPTWLVVGGALVLISVGVSRGEFAPFLARRLRFAAVTIVASAVAAGLAAELVKRLVGRLRPTAEHADRFKPFLSGFADDSNLSMPSSHAAVAFGAAWMIARLAPAPGVLALALASGCGLTRLLVGAHYLSDVLVAAVIGYAGSGVVFRVFRGARPNP